MTEAEYSDEELLELLRQLATELGKSPSQKEMDRAEGYPSCQIYKERFEGWNHAKEQADLETFDRNNDRYTENELLAQLRRLATELGREPEIADLDRSDAFASFQTFVNRFGSWTAAKEQADVRE